jgi:tRNA G10  N-methylase Trm11
MTANEETTTTELDSYLSLVPRGLQRTASDYIHAQLGSSWQVEISFLGENDDASLPMDDVRRKSKRSKLEGCCPDDQAVGSVQVPVYNGGSTQQSRQDINVGYNSRQEVIWTTPGQNSVWLQLKTNASVQVVAALRGLGPLVAFAGSWESKVLSPSQQDANHVAQQLETTISTSYRFSSALNLWKKFALASWNLSESEKETLLQALDNSNPKVMRYRISCLRADSKEYSYTRQQFVTAVADVFVPPSNNWKVDLTKYDVEVVLLVREDRLAVGLALCPYQRVGSKSFATGVVPPDIAPPYLSSLSGIIHLRPATAHLLLHLACLQPGDVLLDPCVGVGTLPTEATFLRPRCGVALGGDIVLTPEGLGPLAAQYTRAVRKTAAGADMLAAWDAGHLPIRSKSIDVIVSDLPFGQRCSSSNQLNILLPLVLAEMARVLVPSTGRIVLLCGSYLPVLQALVAVNNSQSHKTEDSPQSSTEQQQDVSATATTSIWQFPCTAVFPVNIGGIFAWVVQVSRGGAAWPGSAYHLDNVRKLTAKRNRVHELQKNGPAGKPKRLQA